MDEALAHVGDYRVTDIYAERNWELSWEANRKVLSLFRWPGEGVDDPERVPAAQDEPVSGD